MARSCPCFVWLYCLSIDLRCQPRSQHFRDRPGLRNAALRFHRSVTVKNLAEAANAMRVKLIRHGFQKGTGFGGIPIDAQMCQDKWPHEPAPDRSLVVGTITLSLVAPIASLIFGVVGIERSQPVRS